MRAKVQATLRRREGHLLPVAVRHANAHSVWECSQGRIARARGVGHGGIQCSEIQCHSSGDLPRGAQGRENFAPPPGGRGVLPVSACCATRTENMCSCPYCRLR
jgi:hypothetical protein